MLDFKDYSKYKKIGQIVGSSLGIVFISVFFTFTFIFRNKLIASIKNNWGVYIVSLLILLYLNFLLVPIVKKKLRALKILFFFKGFNIGFHNVTENIGKLINLVLLLSVYIFGIGTAYLFKIFRNKSFFELKPSKTKKSYWQASNMGSESKEQYYRQF